MEKAYDEFVGITKAFRRGRALKYDKKYNREHNEAQRNARFAELYDEVEKALGETGRGLLRKFTDSVIELYNTDADYFYNCGFGDCQQIYSKLFNTAPVCSIDDDEDKDGDNGGCAWLDAAFDKQEDIKPCAVGEKPQTADGVL
jgi:hypothetical protein